MSQNKRTDATRAGLTAIGIGGLLSTASCLSASVSAPSGVEDTTIGQVVDLLPDVVMAGGVGMAAFGTSILAQRWSHRGRVRAKYQNPGWPDWWALRTLRRGAALSSSAAVRPSYEHVRWYNYPLRWWQIDPADYAIYLGLSVIGGQWASRLYASYQDVIMVVAPPQTGKTAWLAGALIDAPGAAVNTSTKPDVYVHTHHLRRKRGPVWVFNPQNIGDVSSTLRWDPVRGCERYQTAADRAASLVRGVRGGRTTALSADAVFWEDQATKILRCFLMAAALDGRNLRAVAQWTTSPADPEPLEILSHYAAQVPDGWISELSQIINAEAEKTREGIYLTVQQSMKFMANPIVADTVCPADDTDAFDLATFIRDKGTLYLIGDGREIAPLLVCLSTHLFDGAKDIAAAQPNNRLDPPLMFALDECALIVPVELDRWTADAGGRNITIIYAIQAPSQLFNVYGERGGQTIRTNSNCQLYFGGQTDPQELAAIRDIAGTYEHQSVTEHKGGQREGSESAAETLRPTIDIAGVREIPRNHVLVVYRTTRPTIARTTPVWDRRDVKAAKREAKQQAKQVGKIPAMRAPDYETAPDDVSTPASMANPANAGISDLGSNS